MNQRSMASGAPMTAPPEISNTRPLHRYCIDSVVMKELTRNLTITKALTSPITSPESMLAGIANAGAMSAASAAQVQLTAMVEPMEKSTCPCASRNM